MSRGLQSAPITTLTTRTRFRIIFVLYSLFCGFYSSSGVLRYILRIDVVVCSAENKVVSPCGFWHIVCAFSWFLLILSVDYSTACGHNTRINLYWSPHDDWKFITHFYTHRLAAAAATLLVVVVVFYRSCVNRRIERQQTWKWTALERIATIWSGNTMNVSIHGLRRNSYVDIRTTRCVRPSSKSINIVWR